MTLTTEVQSKLARVVLQRGFEFLEAALKMDRKTLESAAALGNCSEEQGKVITAWVKERVFDATPSSKIRLAPISEK
jgi:hypothetical protein